MKRAFQELKKTVTPQVFMLIAFALILGAAAGYYFGYDTGYENALQVAENLDD
jgi:hypothetical protein